MQCSSASSAHKSSIDADSSSDSGDTPRIGLSLTLTPKIAPSNNQDEPEKNLNNTDDKKTCLALSMSNALQDASDSDDEVSEVGSFMMTSDLDDGGIDDLEEPELELPTVSASDVISAVDADTQARLDALLEAAGIKRLSNGPGKTLTDPEVLRKLTSSVSTALDKAASALSRMRGDGQYSAEEGDEEQGSDVRRVLGEGQSVEGNEDGESLLSLACSAGYFELAQVLLAMHANVEDRGIKGDCTPLMEAANGGFADIVKLLLHHGASVNAQSPAGNTALHYAANRGFDEVVLSLVKNRANVEEHNENGHTPLMEAASEGFVSVAKVLLEAGAGINTHSNEFKESALTLACYKGHLDMVKFLLESGADHEHKTDEMHTALMEAAMDGHVEVARLLLDNGAQVNMPLESSESPLTLAACGGHVELAKLLLARGADLEEGNDEGYTPLMEASREGHEDMVQLLLAHNAQVNQQTEETQETALTLACCGGFMEVARLLLAAGADIELGCSSPLMEAAQEGHLELVRYLLKQGADVQATTGTADTALTWACENGHNDVTELLLQHGAQLEHEAEGGRTPLMKAVVGGHESTVKLLLSKGADVTKCSATNEQTVLSLACSGGHYNIVECLLHAGADPTYKLADGSTMLIEAARGGHSNIVTLLLEWPDRLNSAAAYLQTEMTSPLQLSNYSVEQLRQLGAVIPLAVSGAQLTGATEGLALAERTKLPTSEQQVAGSEACVSSSRLTQARGAVAAAEHSLNESNTSAEQLEKKQQILKELHKQMERELQEKVMQQLTPKKGRQKPVTAMALPPPPMNEAVEEKEGLRPLHETYRDHCNPSAAHSKVLELPPACVDKARGKQEASEAGPVPLHLAFKDQLQVQVEAQKLAAAQGRSPTSVQVSLDDLTYEQVRSSARASRAPAPPSLPLVTPPLASAQPPNGTSETHCSNGMPAHAESLSGGATVSQISDGFVAAAHRATAASSSSSTTGSDGAGELLINNAVSASSAPASVRKSKVREAFVQGSALQQQAALQSLTVQQQQQLLATLQQQQAQIPSQLLSPAQLQQLSQQQQQQLHILQLQMLQQQQAAAAEQAQLQTQLQTKLKASKQTAQKSLPYPTQQPRVPADGSALLGAGPVALDPALYLQPGATSLQYQERHVELDAQTESNHDTALTLACAGGHTDLVRLLVERGAEIEHRDKKGFTPLILAATAGHTEVVGILLEKEADIEAHSERTKDTPLSLACSGGRHDVVELLLKKGAKKEHRNVSDYTPLSLAASGGYVNIIKLLLSHGAEINSRTGSKLGISPLMLAAMNGHTAAVRYLLDMGSDINAQIETNKNTALTLACFQGRHEVVMLLVERKANIEHRAKTGLTPLMEAASGGYVDVGRVLLDRGADVNATPVPSSKDTALTIAADKGHFHFCKLLISQGATIDVKNKKGNSPLWLACNGGHLDVVQLLVSAHADIHSSDNRAVTCLMAAFRKGHVKVVKWLVKHVTQFPSDHDCNKLTVSADKEQLKKCDQCRELIMAAKERQTTEANNNANILLAQLDKEKELEEQRKLQKEKKKAKKKERRKKQKQEEPKQPSPEPECEEAAPSPALADCSGGMEQGAVGLAASAPSPPVRPSSPPPSVEKPSVGLSKRQKKNRRNRRNAEGGVEEEGQEVGTLQSAAGQSKQVAPQASYTAGLLPSVSVAAPVALSSQASTASTLKLVSHIAESSSSSARSSASGASQSSSPTSKGRSKRGSGGASTQSGESKPRSSGGTSPRKSKKSDGWKTVSKKVNKLTVPNVILQRVVGGRYHSNLIAIRNYTGASVELDKAQKGASERHILIKGSPESSQLAAQCVSALIKQPDKSLESLVPGIKRERLLLAHIPPPPGLQTPEPVGSSKQTSPRQRKTQPTVKPRTFQLFSDVASGAANKTVSKDETAFNPFESPIATQVAQVLKGDERKDFAAVAASGLSTSSGYGPRAPSTDANTEQAKAPGYKGPGLREPVSTAAEPFSVSDAFQRNPLGPIGPAETSIDKAVGYRPLRQDNSLAGLSIHHQSSPCVPHHLAPGYPPLPELSQQVNLPSVGGMSTFTSLLPTMHTRPQQPALGPPEIAGGPQGYVAHSRFSVPLATRSVAAHPGMAPASLDFTGPQLELPRLGANPLENGDRTRGFCGSFPLDGYSPARAVNEPCRSQLQPETVGRADPFGASSLSNSWPVASQSRDASSHWQQPELGAGLLPFASALEANYASALLDQENSVSEKRPVSSLQQPGPSVQAPGPSSLQPSGPSLQPSGPSLQAPGSSSLQPGSSSLQPSGPSLQLPGPTLQQPGFSLQQTSPTIHQSVLSFKPTGPSLQQSYFSAPSGLGPVGTAVGTGRMACGDKVPPLHAAGLVELDKAPGSALPGFTRLGAGSAGLSNGYGGDPPGAASSMHELFAPGGPPGGPPQPWTDPDLETGHFMWSTQWSDAR